MKMMTNCDNVTNVTGYRHNYYLIDLINKIVCHMSIYSLVK